MLRKIQTEKEHEIALEQVYLLMQKDIQPGSLESNKLEALSSQIEQYEAKLFPILSIEPIRATN